MFVKFEVFSTVGTYQSQCSKYLGVFMNFCLVLIFSIETPKKLNHFLLMGTLLGFMHFSVLKYVSY